MEPLVDTVARCLDRSGVATDERLAVACSGGGDSTALAHMIAVLARAAGAAPPPVLLHVDHGLRAASGADADAVAALAASLGLRFHLERATVGPGASLEAAARRARYAALDRAAVTLDLAAILVAHTGDDQAETVLHRIVRGTGLAGLGGMAERRGRYLRPLLGRRRAELDAHRARHGLPALEDPMNRDPRFTRVRLRGALLPALRAENPQVDAALCRLGERAAEAAAAIDWAAARVVEAARGAGDGAGLAADALARAPSPIARRALALAAAAVGIGPLDAGHLASLERLAAAPGGGARAVDLPGGRAVREYDRVRLEPTDGAGAGGPAIGPPAAEVVVRGDGGPYAVRAWRPGDRMRPARLNGRSRKLSDLFADLKVPRGLRTAARVVTDPSGVIVWAQHIGQAWEGGVVVCLTGVDPVASNKN